MDHDCEIALVKAFVVPQKRKRYVGFLSSPGRREKFVRELYHFQDFDPACMVPLSGDNDSDEGLLSELRRRGAGDRCYVISVSKDLDGVAGPLEEIVKKVFAFEEGTIISCIPGQLAYYEGEAPKNRFILDARDGPTMQ